ncbi:hypothetical protein [Pacificispira sp.]|uniref:hypothetical protein n=1 Tax=Pacificispira sp. TaxID=2888761 RepID=UPI003BAA8C7B
MSFTNHPEFLRRVLLTDAASCAVLGVVLAGASSLITTLTGLPSELLVWAGTALLPVAAYIALIALRSDIPTWGVWVLILGNAGWILGSVVVLIAVDGLNAMGMVFVVGQALAVLVLTELEFIGLRRQSRRGGVAAA